VVQDAEYFTDGFDIAEEDAIRIGANNLWQIAYQSQSGTLDTLISPTRAYSLTGLINYVWYTHAQRDEWQRDFSGRYGARDAHWHFRVPAPCTRELLKGITK